jgi:hypothetical protein
MTIRLFCSYSRKDEALRQELETHLSNLKRQSLVTWYDGMLEPGSNWDDRIHQELDNADIILLLVSSYFLDSTYCYDTAVGRWGGVGDGEYSGRELFDGFATG